MATLSDEQILHVYKNRKDLLPKLNAEEKARLGKLIPESVPRETPTPPMSMGEEYKAFPEEAARALAPSLGTANYVPQVFQRATEQAGQMIHGIRHAGEGRPPMGLGEKLKLARDVVGAEAIKDMQMGLPPLVGTLARQPVESLAKTIAAPTTRLREDPLGFLSDLFTVATAPAAVAGVVKGPVSSALTAGSAIGPEAEALASINTFGNGITGGITKPQFWKMLMKGDQGLAEAAISHVAAPDELTVVTAMTKQQLRNASKDPATRSAFGKSLVQDQLDALDKPGVVDFTPEEAAAMKTEGFQRLDQVWREQVQPRIESYAEAAGIKSRRKTTSGRYVRLQVEKPAATTGPTGKGLPTYGKRTAGSAKAATGTGENYVTDLDKLVDSTFEDRVVRARANELLEQVKTREILPDAEGNIPETVMYQGKQVPVRRVQVKSGPTIIQEGGKEVMTSSSIPVPAPVAAAYEKALLARNTALAGETGWLDKINHAGLSLYLATPAEAIAHGVGVVGALERAPGIGGALVKWTGPIGRQLASVARAVDLTGPDFANDVMDLARFGATRASQFAGQTHEGLTALLEKIPVYGKVTKALRQKMFGAPETGARGFNGFETRARVAFYRYLREADPTLSKARAAAIVNNEMGTYVNGLAPELVQKLRSIPIAGDPFAAAGVALGKGGAKNIIGMGARGIDAERIFNVYVSAVLTDLALNKAIDGRWSWEIPGKKPGDIRIEKGDGVTVDIPMRLWAPGLSRGLGQFGVGSLIQDAVRGDTDPRKYADDFMIGTVNTALHRTGKMGQAILSALPGGPTTHLTPSGELMRLHPGSVQERVLDAILQVGRPVGTFTDVASTEPSREDLVKSPMARYAIRALPMLGLNVRVGQPERELAGAPIRSENAQVAEYGRTLASQAMALPPEHRMAWIRVKIHEQYGDDARKTVLATQTAVRYIKSRARSVPRSLHEAEKRGMPVPPSPSPQP